MDLLVAMEGQLFADIEMLENFHPPL
ncbi:hypothetical protein DSUL_60287 [Desulfovibrionales bacterium]